MGSRASEKQLLGAGKAEAAEKKTALQMPRFQPRETHVGLLTHGMVSESICKVNKHNTKCVDTGYSSNESIMQR